VSAYPPQGSRAHSGYPPQGGVVHAGYPPQGEGVAAPSISYAGSPFTWYDYFTSVNESPTNVGGAVTSYAVQSGTLPTGVSLNTSTGAITGTPTALKTAANVVIRATGPGGTSDATLNIAVAWFPSSIAGLVAGYDTEAGFSVLETASDGSDVAEAADNDPVGWMSDLSGNGNTVIQATSSAKPSVDANGINSKRCLSFDGGDSIVCAALAGGAETQPNTIIAIGLYGSVAAAHMYDSGDGTNNRNTLFIPGGVNWGLFAGSTFDTGDAADANLHLHVSLYSGAASQTWLDGDSLGTGDASTSDLAGIQIGREAGNSLPANSKVAVLAVYGADIGATARTNLHTWAQAKWATPA